MPRPAKTQNASDSRPDTMLSGTIIVRKRLFFQPETHYAIVKAINPDKDPDKEFTFKGILENCCEGAKYNVKGYMQNDQDRGPYFKIKHSEFQESTSTGGLIEYLLREGPNLGDLRSAELVTIFGDKVIHVLANEPDKVKSQIKGLTDDRLRELSDWAKEEFVLSDTKKMLYGLGLTPGLVRKLIMKFGRATAKVIKDDPFQTMDVDGIGFVTATLIADKVGCPANHPRRIRCGVLHTMEVHAEDGHTCILGDRLIEKAQRLLAVGRDLIIKCIQDLIKEQELCTQDSNPSRFAKNPDLFVHN